MSVSLEEAKRRLKIIRRWEKSGMTQVGFCRKESMPPWRFYKWLVKSRNGKYGKSKASASGKFVKLTPAPPKSFTGNMYAEMVFKNGTIIRFHQPVPSIELKQLAGI
jgi:hypothetical protein